MLRASLVISLSSSVDEIIIAKRADRSQPFFT
ncbi:hypothetical protein [Salmonella phage SD-1_S14]|nr:hypothetical protein [Salmonella phage SD-1_S14]